MRRRFGFWGSALWNMVRWLWGAWDHMSRLAFVLPFLALAGVLGFFPHIPYLNEQGIFQPPSWAWLVALFILVAVAFGEGVFEAARDMAGTAPAPNMEIINTEGERVERMLTASNPQGLEIETTVTEAGEVRWAGRQPPALSSSTAGQRSRGRELPPGQTALRLEDSTAPEEARPD